MKLNLIVTLLSFATLAALAADTSGTLENKAVAWHWRVTGGKLRPTKVDDKLNGKALSLDGECFQVVLGDGAVLKSSSLTLAEAPRIEALKTEPNFPNPARHESGKQFIAKFSAPDKNFSVEWRVILRENSTYLRPELTLRAIGNDVPVKEIVLFEQKIPEARTAGTVDGSPVVAGNFFFGYEHPMAQNLVDSNELVRCSYVRNAVLKNGETLEQSCVIGVTPAGQLRRGFLGYVERERAHPYRPFLHYNSWYDIHHYN